MVKGFVLWCTGLPCSGKSTIIDLLEKKLKRKRYKYLVEKLDGDIVRKSLTKDLGFSPEDRKTNLERVTFVAKLLSRNGVGVLCAFVSPNIEVRKSIRENTTNFIEVHVHASPSICCRRDVKGMWQLAEEGKIKGFTGYDAPYEMPRNPEIFIETEWETVEQSVAKIIRYLRQRMLI